MPKYEIELEIVREGEEEADIITRTVSNVRNVMAAKLLVEQELLHNDIELAHCSINLLSYKELSES